MGYSEEEILGRTADVVFPANEKGAAEAERSSALMHGKAEDERWHTPEMLAAAYLHDVVEDTPITIDEIRAEFGEEVGELVDWLTDVSRPEDGNCRARKELDRQHLSKAPAAAKTIKLADLIDNTLSIRARDPSFWKVYRREKLALLEVLKEGDASLWRKANEQSR